MNGHLWRSLYLTTHNPVFEGYQTTVDLSVFSEAKYPALQRLKAECTTLEVLLLAQLILSAENECLEGQFCSELELQEYFENYKCTPADVLNSILNLEKKQWVESFIEQSDDSLHFKANLAQLIKEGLYTDNPWRHLFRLGLYGTRLCRN